MAKIQPSPKQQQLATTGGNSGGSVILNVGPSRPATFEIVNSRCKICQSTHRREIDMQLATGWSQADVLRFWNNAVRENEGDKDWLNHVNMSTHKKNHLSTRDAAVRRIIEERARQEAIDIENVQGYIVTRMGVLDYMVMAGLENIHHGTTVIEGKDMIAAMQMADKLESEFKEVAIEKLLSDFKTFADAVKELVPEDLFQEIYDLFELRSGVVENSALKKMPMADLVLPAGDVTEED